MLREAKEVAGLKEQDGGPILVAGSRTLVHGLMEHGLVDDLPRPSPSRSCSEAVTDPSPRRRDKTPLKLADTRSFDSGVVVQSYDTGGSPA